MKSFSYFSFNKFFDLNIWIILELFFDLNHWIILIDEMIELVFWFRLFNNCNNNCLIEMI